MKYSKQDFIEALRAAGVQRGDLIMVHTGMSSLRAMPEGVKNQEELSAFCANALFEALGEEGTLCVPSFSYSLGGGNVFDSATTPTNGIGEFPEYFWKLPGVLRSNDPFLAIAAKGPRAEELLKERAHTSYGYGSFFDVFAQADGKLVTIGVGMRWSTIRYHFVEIADAPFRYMKVFEGKRRVNGHLEPVTWQYSVAPRAPMSDKMSRQLGFIVEDKMAAEGVTTRAPIGRGFISCIGAQKYRNYIVELLKREPWISGGDIHSVEQIIDEEEQRTGKKTFNITLESSNVEELAEKLTPLPRYPISDGYDAALTALQSKFPLTVEKILTGTRLNNWVVPERWLCRSAQLKTVGDECLLDLETNPLMVASNSRSIRKLVTRAELLQHVYTPSTDVDAAPYFDRDVQRTWGICCSQSQLDELTDEVYKVELDTDFSFGQAKIGEWFIQGSSEETILFVTHLDAPYQFNAGLSGVIAGLQLMERLQKQSRRFSYRLLILPHKLGAAGWSALHQEAASKVVGGVALDGLAIPRGALTLYKSASEDTLLDRLTDDFAVQSSVKVRRSERALSETMRRFLGVDYDLPLMMLIRQAAGGRLECPYPDWSTDADNWRAADFNGLVQAVDWLKKFLDRLEGGIANVVPVR